MDCPECEVATVAFPVGEQYREYLPGDEGGAALCPNCLRLHPVGEPPDEPESFESLGDGFPQDPEAAVPMAIVLGLLSSLALYRSELADLLGHVERAGTDPLLVIDRLADDTNVESSVDLRRRRRQLEALV